MLQKRLGQNGEYIPDATSDAADPTNYDGGYRYVAEGPFINWAEKTRLDALANARKDGGEKTNLNGVFFTSRRVDDK